MNIQTKACLLFALGSPLIPSPTAAAQSAIPPFIAEARLLTEEFRADTNLAYNTSADVVFLYSNGWWQIEARYKYANRDVGVITENCMRIPDGTRSYIIFASTTNQGLATMANACPRPIPPTGRTELLMPWLALCPQPELPLIDGRRMRGFINVIDYRPKIFNALQNRGHYDVKYLAPEDAFLSELVFTNSGFSLDLNVMNPPLEDEGEIRRYPAPFDDGYIEFHYRVVASHSNNLTGVTFPARAICEYFRPVSGGKDRNDLKVWLRSDLAVTRISFDTKRDMNGRFKPPANLIAEDTRTGVSITYRVNEDQWKPVSDPEIQRRARISRQSERQVPE